MFCDSAATLRAHKIIKMTAQTKISIYDEINSPLLGKRTKKRRDIVEDKALCALNLGVQ